MPKKNKKKSKDSFFDDLEDIEPTVEDAPESGGCIDTKGKKKGKKGNQEESNKFDILEEEGMSDADQPELEPTTSKSKENGQNAFMAPDEDGADGVQPSSPDVQDPGSEVPLSKAKKKKSKKGRKNLDNAFAFLEEDDNDVGQDIESDGKKSAVQAQKKVYKQEEAGKASHMNKEDQEERNAPTVDREMDGTLQTKTAGGLQSSFAVLGSHIEEEEHNTDNGKRSGNRRDQDSKDNSVAEDVGKAFQSGFAALAVDDGDDALEDTPAPSMSKKKGGKKGKKVSEMDSIFAALADDREDHESGPPPPSDEGDTGTPSTSAKAKGRKKVKTAKKEEEKEDLDSMFAALGEDDGAAEAKIPLPPEPSQGTQGKKKKKQKKSTKDAEDIEALLREIDGTGAPDEKEAAAEGSESAAECRKSKPETVGNRQDSEGPPAKIDVAPTDKSEKEGEEAAKYAVKDVDSTLEELGTYAKTDEEAKAATPVAVSAEHSKDLDEANDSVMEAAEGGKELSAKEKKKLKKKQKEKEKKLQAKTAASENAAEVKPKGKEKKVPAHLRRMQEEIERRRLEEERLKKEEEERAIREEEEKKRQEEEERLRKEEHERKKKEKAERQKQQKILLKQKAEEERRARALERLVISKQSLGDRNDGKAQDKMSYAEKKKQRLQEAEERKKAAEELRLIAMEEERKKKEEIKKQEEEAAGRKETESHKDAAADDWEEVADTWEDIEEDVGKVNDGEVVKEESGVADTSTSPTAGQSKSSVDDDDDEEDSSEEESSSYETDSEEERERRVTEVKQKMAARVEEAKAQASVENLRSPICCILGHVDTGKTKILDNIRRTNVQDGEAGGITQQIGATYIPKDAIMTRTQDLRKGREYDMKVPGLLVIDTPGHESFTNLRSRGSSLCDIAILVVDLMHGLEPQTIESLNLLRNRKTPFIVALNKVDRLLEWKVTANAPIRDSLNRQKKHTTADFEDRLKFCTTQLMEQGLNVALYWKNKDPRKFVSMVPTSAITGEGIPDLLQLLVKLTTAMMSERLMFLSELQCTVLEVKAIEGLGTTIDVVLVNGVLKEGDKIVVCGMVGPIVTTIRSLLTPHPLKELRVKGSYLHHKAIQAAQGIKICAQGLEHAVAGTALYVVGEDEEEEELTALAQEEMEDVLGRIDKSGEGVCVQASTLGSLEALLDFLKTPEVSIAVSAIAIGPVHKKDVIRANVMNEKGLKKFGVILAFDVPVSREAREVAQDLGVRIFTADIIYHLFDQFKAYMEEVKKAEKMAARDDAVFPCILRIMPSCVFNKKDPIVLGVEVVEGQARIGSPLCIPASAGRPEINLGRIESMEVNHKMIDEVKAGDSFAVKIRATNAEESAKLYGRHFDHNDELYSRITRESIDALKQYFRDEMDKDGWRLVLKLKSVFKIQ